MTENDRLLNPDVPKSIDDALKIAKSLAYWIDYIKSNPLKIDDPMGSFGGHIEGHILVLQLWFTVEKINVLTKNLGAATEVS